MSVRLSPVLSGLGTYPFVRLEAERARLRAAGLRRAARFSWERSAREIDALLVAEAT